ARRANSGCRCGAPGPSCQARVLLRAASPANSPAAAGLELAGTGRLDNPGSSSGVFADPGKAVRALSVNERGEHRAPDWDEKLRGVQSITDRALSELDSQTLLDTLVARVRDALQADTAAVLLLDEPSGYLVATAASGLEEEVQQGVKIHLGHGFAG